MKLTLDDIKFLFKSIADKAFGAMADPSITSKTIRDILLITEPLDEELNGPREKKNPSSTKEASEGILDAAQRTIKNLEQQLRDQQALYEKNIRMIKQGLESNSHGKKLNIY